MNLKTIVEEIKHSIIICVADIDCEMEIIINQARFKKATVKIITIINAIILILTVSENNVHADTAINKTNVTLCRGNSKTLIINKATCKKLATCSRCKKTRGTYAPHKYKKTIVPAAKSEQG